MQIHWSPSFVLCAFISLPLAVQLNAANPCSGGELENLGAVNTPSFEGEGFESRDGRSLYSHSLPSGDPFDDETVVQYLSDLLREGGMGRMPRERAAFVTIKEDGGYQCLMWPKTGGFNSESFTGRLPERVVAIAHTHPREIPVPSAGDRAEAARLQIPFIILTPRHVEVVMPDGSHRSVTRNVNWYRPASKIRCERMPRE